MNANNSAPLAVKSNAKTTLHLEAFHLLATLLLMVDDAGVVVFANAATQYWDCLGGPLKDNYSKSYSLSHKKSLRPFRVQAKNTHRC